MRRASGIISSLAIAVAGGACADLIGFPGVPDITDAGTMESGLAAGNAGGDAMVDGGGGLADAGGDGEAGPARLADAAPEATTCSADPICATLGPTCNASNSSVVTCALNDAGCLSQAGSEACTGGACGGEAGAAACCTNACTAPACLTTSSTQMQACTLGTNGCMTPSTVSCGPGLVCERYGTAACVDPNWSEWPMPNDPTTDPSAPNAMSYTDNGNGTVTDNVTGLVWQQTAPSGGYTWGSASTSGTAQNYCATLQLAGYSDWRLPSIEELTSLFDPGVASTSINATYFPASSQAFVWSSTPVAGASSSVFGIGFNGSGTGTAYATKPCYVRCVR